MSAFFELRIYQIFPGKMDEWLSFMEKNNNAISNRTGNGNTWQFCNG